MFHFVWCLIVYLHTLCGTSVRNTLQCDSLPFHYFIKCRLKEIPFLQTLCGKKMEERTKNWKGQRPTQNDFTSPVKEPISDNPFVDKSRGLKSYSIYCVHCCHWNCLVCLDLGLWLQYHLVCSKASTLQILKPGLRMIKTLTANKNLSCFKELENWKRQTTKLEHVSVVL